MKAGTRPKTKKRYLPIFVSIEKPKVPLDEFVRGERGRPERDGEAARMAETVRQRGKHHCDADKHGGQAYHHKTVKADIGPNAYRFYLLDIHGIAPRVFS
ncbi:hypothetical protein HB778_07010 [Mesorhizobium huakuii]|uniref:Uncharacterized protein n=1 Tax=Mesorhizobium huakuii TaxID=28104 RepID=A0A7G6SPG5_9HYPH|nr:hypothetical protein [Mesorhizobium huakuii]QND56397.1 hypothetical protein HB778_07010 [Mesorhizobium huakuii]